MNYSTTSALKLVQNYTTLSTKACTYCHIDYVLALVYNIDMKQSGQVDEAKTNRLAKLLEWLRQHGKTAINNKGDKHHVYYRNHL